MPTYTITYHINGEPEHMHVSEDITAHSLQEAEATAGGKITAGNFPFIVIPRNDELSTVLPCSSIAYASVELKKDASITADDTPATASVLPYEAAEQAKLTLEP